MVPPKGLEPLIPCLEGRCLIQFGHGGNYYKIEYINQIYLFLSNQKQKKKKKRADTKNRTWVTGLQDQRLNHWTISAFTI